MKRYPVLVRHNAGDVIGWMVLDETKLPTDANYRFEVGGRQGEDKTFQLCEVSLVTWEPFE